MWSVRYEWENLIEGKEADRMTRQVRTQDEKQRLKDLNTEYYSKVMEAREAKKRAKEEEVVPSPTNEDNVVVALTPSNVVCVPRRKKCKLLSSNF